MAFRTLLWTSYLFASLVVPSLQAQCNIRFEDISIMQVGSVLLSVQHYDGIISLDNTTPNGSVYAGCLLNYFGSACTWQRGGNSSLAGYTISHVPLGPFGDLTGTKMNVTGNGCDGTTLTCTWQSALIPVDPGDGTVPVIYQEAITTCDLNGGGGDAFKTINVGEITEKLAMNDAPFGCSTCSVGLSTTTTGVNQPTLTCVNAADPDNCIGNYYSCYDSHISVAYAASATDISYLMTIGPTDSPTFLPLKPSQTPCCPHGGCKAKARDVAHEVPITATAAQSSPTSTKTPSVLAAVEDENAALIARAPNQPASGGGTWGTNFVAGGCGGKSAYAGFNNKPLYCYNLATSKAWDSILLTKGDGLQIQLFSAPNCYADSQYPCSVYNGAQNGTCVQSLGPSNGNGFAKSIAIVKGPTDAFSRCSVQG